MNMDAYLKAFTPADKKTHNYTKIGNDKLGIYGGCYCIPPEKKDDFYNKYINHVFRNKQLSYLTEKQLEDGPILIDLDFRYDPDVEDRCHTMDDVNNLVEYIFGKISCIKLPTENNEVTCTVCEKPNINSSSDDVTKDGIHIIINIQMDISEKILFRDELLKDIDGVFKELPITNSWDQVIDEGVMKGSVNWQLLGSRKPGNEAYEITNIFKCIYKNNDWEIEQINYNEQYILDNFNDFTARNTNLVTFKTNPLIHEEYEKKKLQRLNGKSRVCKVKMLTKFDNTKQHNEISSSDELDNYIDRMMSKYSLNDQYIRDTYNYVMALDDSYYGEGSYNKWIKVGMALKNTDNNLFVIWLKLSSRSESFDWSGVNELYNKWDTLDGYGLTFRSIIYWCKDCSPDSFYKIQNDSINKYINYSFYNATDYDIAKVLHQAYKESYICVNNKNNIWYEFINHKWEQIDSGTSLRMTLSNDIYNLYNKIVESKKKDSNNEEETKDIVSRFSKISKILKTTTDKNNIMKESRELFYDKDFYNKLDANPYLVGCKNGIIDIKNKVFRKGIHEDYVSLSTNNTYKPLDHYRESSPHIIEEINEFFGQLFPDEDLKEYMWEHLASTLLGTNQNQTFNIYTGSGANGKSKLVELMQKVLGDYKGTVPSTLITQKRSSIGTTSSEVYQLIGKRYAVMQETSKGDTINEGIMKEITGGDPIQCRALFKDSVTFTPQFKLVVCTNTLFDIKSNDDGTWRRIRVCQFKSKFTNNPYSDKAFPKKDYPHQFMIDTKIDEKFKHWVPVFLSMLVEIAYETQGKVKDAECVLEPTKTYRNGQDIFLEFCNAFIIDSSEDNTHVKIGDIADVFKQWHTNEYGNQRSAPNNKELREYLERKYGKCTKSGWSHIAVKDDNDT